LKTVQGSIQNALSLVIDRIAPEAPAQPKQVRVVTAELAQIERNIREGEARLPPEEQLSLKLRRFIEANIPEVAGNVRVEKQR
jgi:hypothetical protein